MLKYILIRNLKKLENTNCIIKFIKKGKYYINLSDKELWIEFFINPNRLVKFRVIKSEFGFFRFYTTLDFMSEYDITIEDCGHMGTHKDFAKAIKEDFFIGYKRYGLNSSSNDYFYKD